MKYIVLLGDGMADEQIMSLGGGTPLEAAKKPNMDAIAGMGEMGLVRTIPRGMKPDTVIADLAVLGFDPEKYYTGRAPLEALSLGVDLAGTDVCFRAKFVSLSGEKSFYDKKLVGTFAGMTTVDEAGDGKCDSPDGDAMPAAGEVDAGEGLHDLPGKGAALAADNANAGEGCCDSPGGNDAVLTADEAKELADAVREKLGDGRFSLYSCGAGGLVLVWHRGRQIKAEAPQDHIGEAIRDCAPRDDELCRMMETSFDILKSHPVNARRASLGLMTADALWVYDGGKRPPLENFKDRTGLRGAMISADGALTGLAAGVGMRVINARGADGTLQTNYEGRARAAVRALLEDGDDFVFLHISAADEMALCGDIDGKINAVENIDEKVLGVVLSLMRQSGEPFRLLLLPGVATPVEARAHTDAPVPYVIYDCTRERRRVGFYAELDASDEDFFIPRGEMLFNRFIGR